MPRFKSHRLKKEEEKDDGSVPPRDALIDESPSLSFSMKGKGKGSSSKFWSRRSNSNTKKTQKSKLNGSFVSKSSTTVSRASLASLSSVVKSISSSLSPSKKDPPSPPRGSDTNNDDNNNDDNNYSLLAETMPLFELNIETSSLLSEDQAQQMYTDTNTDTDTDSYVVNQQQHEIRDTIIIEDDENNNFSNNTPRFRILKRLDDEKTEETEEDEEEEEHQQLQTVNTTCTNEDTNQISYFFEDSMSTIDPVSSVAGGTGDDGSDSVGSLSLSPSVHVPLAASSRAFSTTWGPALTQPLPVTLPPQRIPNYTTDTDHDHDYTFTPIFDGQFDDSTTHEKEFFTETPPPLPVSQRRSTNKKKHQHQHQQPQNEFDGSDSCDGGGSSSPLAGETILSALEQQEGGVEDTTTQRLGTSRLSPLSCSGGGTSPTDIKTEFTDSFRQIQHQFQLLLLSSTSKSASASKVSPTKTKTVRNHKNNNGTHLNLDDDKSVYTDDLIAPMCSVGPLKCFYYSDGFDTDRPDECLTYDTDAAIHNDESRHSVVTTAIKNVTTALQNRQQHHQEQQQEEPQQSQSRYSGGGNMCGGGGGSVVGFPEFDHSQWDPVVETKSSF